MAIISVATAITFLSNVDITAKVFSHNSRKMYIKVAMQTKIFDSGANFQISYSAVYLKRRI